MTDEADFYLLAKSHDNRECFRFCWGAFDSRDQAAAQQRFPAALAAMTLPNLFAILALSGQVARLSNEYFSREHVPYKS